MKLTFVSVFLSIICFLSSSNSCDIEKVDKITIVNIESSKLENYFYIIFKHSSGKSGILLSKYEQINCEEKIRKGEDYSLILSTISTTEGITNPVHRLYRSNVYIDGELIFPKDKKVYYSINLKGLCLK